MPSLSDHRPAGDPCDKCGRPGRRHRQRAAYRRGYMRDYNREHPRPNPVERIIGIDGEGQGRGPHVYKYLAAADEEGFVWSCEGRGDLGRVTTEQFLDFVLALPNRALVFAFAFLYDLTKGLQDVPDRKLYLLFHEKRRTRIVDGKALPIPVRWGRYTLNYVNRRFTVGLVGERNGKRAIVRQRTVWDIFAFYQSKFTKALADWKVGTAAELEYLAAMKDKRARFDRESWDKVKSYCQTECRRLAELGRRLIVAHADAGLQLRSYHGAGSTASVLLKKFGIREMRGEIPDAMREAIACAFFGGWFENSRIGPVRQHCYNDDISSAYPYHCTFLPCLVHGRWELVREPRDVAHEARGATLALVHWASERSPPGARWGQLPVRKVDGTIAFPLACPPGGWTWRDEFVAAQRLNPYLHATEAWVYRSECECRPFGQLPWYYLERCRIGKEGAGIVFKLGPNSVYGKLAESRSFDPPYQSWVWAGNVTSGCRAQLLNAMSRARSLDSILMVATDGIWSTEPLDLPAPRDTGTGSTGKPLGGWERKEYPRGVFAVRPGIYFPLEPTEDDLEKVRARGLGRRVLYENWEKIVRAFERGDEGVAIEGASRFVGAKSGVTWGAKSGARHSPSYGEWVPHATDVSFDPRPKRRPGYGADGRLHPWERFDVPSLPYEEATKSQEAKLLELAEIHAEEQPDADYMEVK